VWLLQGCGKLLHPLLLAMHLVTTTTKAASSIIIVSRTVSQTAEANPQPCMSEVILF
jgi:hypothetical protein